MHVHDARSLLLWICGLDSEDPDRRRSLDYSFRIMCSSSGWMCLDTSGSMWNRSLDLHAFDAIRNRSIRLHVARCRDP